MVSVYEQQEQIEEGLQETGTVQTEAAEDFRTSITRVFATVGIYSEAEQSTMIGQWFRNQAKYGQYGLSPESAALIVVDMASQLAPEAGITLKTLGLGARKEPKPAPSERSTKLNLKQRRTLQVKAFNKYCKSLSTAAIRVLWYFENQARNYAEYPGRLVVKTSKRSLATHLGCATRTAQNGIRDLLKAGVILRVKKGKKKTGEYLSHYILYPHLAA
jgi:hypothetical protein